MSDLSPRIPCSFRLPKKIHEFFSIRRKRKAYGVQTRLFENAIDDAYDFFRFCGLNSFQSRSYEQIVEVYKERNRPRNAKPQFAPPRDRFGKLLCSPLSPTWRFKMKEGQRVAVSTRLHQDHLRKLYEVALFLDINLTDAFCEILAHSIRGRFEKKLKEQRLNDFMEAVEVTCEPSHLAEFNQQFEDTGW